MWCGVCFVCVWLFFYIFFIFFFKKNVGRVGIAGVFFFADTEGEVR